MTYLQCKKHESCEHELKIVLPSDGSDPKTWSNKKPHSRFDKAAPLTSEDFAAVEKAYLSGFKKPNQIHAHFLETEQPEIQHTRLKNILTKLRAKYEAPAIISIGDLKKFAIENMIINELGLDTAGVFEYDIGDDGNFKIFFSTRRLLQLSTISQSCHLDGTYKLNYQGFPLIVIGGSDDARVKQTKAKNTLFIKYKRSFTHLD